MGGKKIYWLPPRLLSLLLVGIDQLSCQSLSSVCLPNCHGTLSSIASGDRTACFKFWGLSDLSGFILIGDTRSPRTCFIFGAGGPDCSRPIHLFSDAFLLDLMDSHQLAEKKWCFICPAAAGSASKTAKLGNSDSPFQGIF